MNPATRSLLTIIALALSVVGCGGGSSGDSGLPSGDPGATTEPSTQTPASGSFNGGLTGRLITSIDGESMSIDLATGQSSPLALNLVKDIIANSDTLEFEDVDDVIFASDQTANAALIQTYARCIKEDPGFVENGCYAVYNSDLSQLGTVSRINSTELDWGVGARLSRSKQRVVTVDYDRASREADDKAHIEIWNLASSESEMLLTLEVNFSFGADRSGAPAVEWGLNDELIYTNADTNPPTIFITEPGTYDVARTIRLPSRYQGIVSRLDLSPDGTKLLIEYERFGFVSGAFPIILDLQSLSITIPAIAESDTVPLGDEGTSMTRIRGWSPDGNWILLEHLVRMGLEQVPGGFTPVPISSRLIVAVPATSVNAVLSSNPATMSSDVVPLQFFEPDASGELRGVRAGLQILWLP